MNDSSQAAPLRLIRRELFRGVTSYRKLFPDLAPADGFEDTGPRAAQRLLAEVADGLASDAEILLYIHLPFCATECAFCNTAPHKAHGEAQARYIEALLREVDVFADAGVFGGRTVRTIYMGGGTPTAFAVRDLARVLDRVRARAALAPGCRVTCEAHPATMRSARRAAALAEMGVDRVSLGCQSFDPDVLAWCRREGSEALTAQALGHLRAAGLESNVDMMIGLPGQTLASVERDLEALDRLRPDAVEVMRHEVVNRAAIGLLEARPDLGVDDDALFEMVRLTQRWLVTRGYEQNGHFTSDRCFPHRYHWLRGKPLLGLGARARSYLPAVCFDKHDDLGRYERLSARGLPAIGRALRLSPRQQAYRAAFLGLQLRPGVDRAAFALRFGEDPVVMLRPEVERLLRLGCVELDEGAVRLTHLGRTFIEDVSGYLVDAAAG